jgi:tRNA dimethylallyltransferase
MTGHALIFIVGPTAAGKSEIGVCAAERLKAEIICCDAMQVYREIAVASDKPSAKARGLVRHHLTDIISVTEDFNPGCAVPRQNTFDYRRKRPVYVGLAGWDF